MTPTHIYGVRGVNTTSTLNQRAAAAGRGAGRGGGGGGGGGGCCCVHVPQHIARRRRRSGRKQRFVGIGSTSNSNSTSSSVSVPSHAKASHEPEARALSGAGGRAPWVQGVKIVGCGSSVPGKTISNHDLEKLVETNDEWITTRTGIQGRRVLAEDEVLSGHASIAAEKAMEAAGIVAEDLDLILLATSTPDDLFGSACQVQASIGAHNAAAFDITSACSGFVVALITGAQYVRCGTYKNVLVVGADALSRFVDWNDRNTCILFGDGCGAAVLSAQDAKEFGCNLISFAIESDGTGRKYLNAGYSGNPDKTGSGYDKRGADGSYSNIYMSGQDVFKWAVRAVPAVVKKSLEQTELTVDDIDWLVLHQANKRILGAAGDRLKIPKEKIISNISQYGNTSAGSVPLALDEAVRKGQIKSGDLIATAGFGAGLTCASALFYWD